MKALLVLVSIALLFTGCGKKPVSGKSAAGTSTSTSDTLSTNSEAEIPAYPKVEFEVVKKDTLLETYYDIDFIKEWYGKRVHPPEFDFSMDLSNKTYLELRLLRNEIAARHGYLFKDATLRAYFNQFKWYQPIFDVPGFRIQITKQEKTFLDTVMALENLKSKARFDSIGGHRMIALDHVVNLTQFERVNEPLTRALRSRNFALASASNDQLFYVYDRNQYGYIPNFITTDLYLQVLHKYLSSLFRRVEGTELVPLTGRLVQHLYEISRDARITDTDKPIVEARAWANTYLAIASSTLQGRKIEVESTMREMFSEELGKIEAANGMGSRFLDRSIFDYSQFRPRGNYTENDTLRRYFRCMKWLNSAPINLDDEKRFLASLLMAYWIRSDAASSDDFKRLNEVVRVFAGEENGFSMTHLIHALESLHIKRLEDLANPETIQDVKKYLASQQLTGISEVAGSEAASKELARTHVLFTSSRYTFDADVLSHLVHVLRPNPLRPFPKALDVFAVLGDSTAEDILMNDYREAAQWPAYADSLKRLKARIGGHVDWNQSIFNKSVECIRSLGLPIDGSYPLFMQTTDWQKKNLSTSLAAWAELKHDMQLYTVEASGAEAGEGGGPAPPLHLSYVEPNIAFWNCALNLLAYESASLSALGFHDAKQTAINEGLANLGTFLRGISTKELKGDQISDHEFEQMSWIGGKIESLTLQIMQTDALPERERKIAEVVDVYSYNGTALEEAVGQADEIYVVAEINGLPYLTKGACFSYYEFQNAKRLTDEEWREQTTVRRSPPRPRWLNDLYVETPSLKSERAFEDFLDHR